jgi:Tol biopolymer transport system component
VSNRDAETAIYLVPPLGGAVQKLVDTGFPPLSRAASGVLGSNPWSPDGRQLVFARMLAQGNSSLYTIDLDSGEETQITHPEAGEYHGSASWSHDGERLAFAQYTAQGTSVWTVNLRSGKREMVYDDEYEKWAPAWSPDDKEIVYSSDRGGAGNLWVVSLAKGKPSPLTTGQMDDGDAVVGRNGDIIYSSTSHQTDLYLQDLASEEQQRLTQHTQDNFGAKLSPDGRRVAYMSTRTGNAEIWVLDLESGSERQITNHDGYDGGPTWSPDGREILFGSDRGGIPEAWVVNADGGAPRKLTNGKSGAKFQPRWAPEGETIGFLTRGEGGNELWLVNRDGSEPRKVLDGVDDYGFYRDAGHVVYTPEAEGVSAEMRVRNLESGDETVLFSGPHRELEVAPDGSGISYCSAASHFNMNLHVLWLTPPSSPGGLPAPRGEPETVTHGKGLWHVHNGGWSPDGKQVIYTRDTDAGDILVMTGVF